DWSSDVCSTDLIQSVPEGGNEQLTHGNGNKEHDEKFRATIVAGNVSDQHGGECEKSYEHGVDQHGHPHAIVLDNILRCERLKQEIEHHYSHPKVAYEPRDVFLRKHDRCYVQEGVVHKRHDEHGDDNKRRQIQHVAVPHELGGANFPVVLSFIAEISCLVYTTR